MQNVHGFRRRCDAYVLSLCRHFVFFAHQRPLGTTRQPLPIQEFEESQNLGCVEWQIAGWLDLMWIRYPGWLGY